MLPPMSGAGPLGAPGAAISPTPAPIAAPLRVPLSIPGGPPPVGMPPPSGLPNPGRAMRFGIPNVMDRSDVNGWRR